MEFYFPGDYHLTLGRVDDAIYAKLSSGDGSQTYLLYNGQYCQMKDGEWVTIPTGGALEREEFETEQEYLVSGFVEKITAWDDEPVLDFEGGFQLFDAIIDDQLAGRPLDWIPTSGIYYFDIPNLYHFTSHQDYQRFLKTGDEDLANAIYEFPTTGSDYFDFNVRDLFRQ
jgi:hypothetical protein